MSFQNSDYVCDSRGFACIADIEQPVSMNDGPAHRFFDVTDRRGETRRVRATSAAVALRVLEGR